MLKTLKFEHLIYFLSAIVSVGQAVVRVHVTVGVGSVGVVEGGVVVGGVSVVTSPHSGVVHPGVGLGVSLGISGGLSHRLGLSLLHSNSGLLLNSSGGGGGHNSGGYETSMGAGNEGYT